MKKLSFFLVATMLWSATIGQKFPHVILDGEQGGLVPKGAFDSKILNQKTYLIVYSDPDKRDLNEDFFKKVKARHFDRSRYGSLAIVNLKATWLPNFLIEAILRKKQKSYPDTIYVKDKKKVLVKKWGIADNDQVIMITRNGTLLFEKAGKLSEKEEREALDILQRSVDGTNR